jgi:predicted MPP superfamily phosphohydrolase
LAEARVAMEKAKAKAKVTPAGPRGHRDWPLFRTLMRVGWLALRATRLHRLGMRNALKVRLQRHEVALPGLPPAFDGYTILHISDPHIVSLYGLAELVAGRVAGLEVDLCALTGDYRRRIRGPHAQILPGMRTIVDAIEARDGILGILGNHDCAAMVPDFEDLGIRMLINETVTVTRGGEAIHLSGVDDVHYYYTPEVRGTFEAAPEGFRVALVHSPEAADLAAEAGYALYLTGHTHGGQVALPGGRPILTHLTRHRAYARGFWRHGRIH